MNPSSRQRQYFTEALLAWYDPDQRPLPWKHIDDPYLIWLSEIILQQTRVEQGQAYYERFKEQYPTVKELAAAPEDDVLKLWEGLGYYSRARNLHATAKFIAQERDGVFPSTYEDILALKGVGPYTAAAIASFAYDLPHAVVDGNVFRVLARYADEVQAIDSTAGKKLFQQLAQDLLPTDQAALYNQAIMDLGATICTPKAPRCSDCPLQKNCQAFHHETVLERPVKAKRLKRRQRYFHYLILQAEDERVVQKRAAKDIWQGLYQFPLVEHSSAIETWAELTTHPDYPEWLQQVSGELIRQVGPQKQDLSHQRIIGTFWEIQLSQLPPELPVDLISVERKNLRKFAFPKIIDWYLSDKSLYLF